MKPLFPKRGRRARQQTVVPPSSWALGAGTGGTSLVTEPEPRPVMNPSSPMLEQGQLHCLNFSHANHSCTPAPVPMQPAETPTVTAGSFQQPPVTQEQQ